MNVCLFLHCVTVYFAFHRWDYWRSSEYHENQKCPIYCNIHRTAAITSEIFKLTHMKVGTSCTRLLLILLLCVYTYPVSYTVNIQTNGIWRNFNVNHAYLPLQVISEISMPNQPVGRSLLQASGSSDNLPIIFNGSSGPCIMLWAQSLSVAVLNSSTLQWIDFAAPNITPILTFTGSQCNETNSV